MHISSMVMRKSRIGFKSHLGIFPMSWGWNKKATRRIIFSTVDLRHSRRLRTKDHLMQTDIIIFAPAGNGVKTGWQVILRSKHLFTDRMRRKMCFIKGNSIVKRTAPGALVDTVNGDEWFLHFQDRGLYGRIVHIF